MTCWHKLVVHESQPSFVITARKQPEAEGLIAAALTEEVRNAGAVF